MAGPNDNDQDNDSVQGHFGADGYAVSNNDDGGQHHTVFDSDGGSSRFSWDSDSSGNYVDGSAHISDQ